MSMKIALICEQYNPEGGGAERNVYEAASMFKARGHDVVILAGSAAASRVDGCQEVNALYSNKLKYPWRLKTFSSWISHHLNSGRFDSSLSFTMMAPATVVQPLSGTFRETFHRNILMHDGLTMRSIKSLGQLLSTKKQLSLHLEQRTAADQRVKAFAAISGYVFRQLRDLSIPETKIHLTHQVVPTCKINLSERAAIRNRFRVEWNIEDDTVVFLFAAFNPRLKGYAPLLKAMRRLSDMKIKAVLLVAGKCGYTESQMAYSAGVRTNIRMLGVTQAMNVLFCASDVTVLPTFYDSAGRVIIESLLFGVPVITTAFAGASDLVCADAHGSRGRVISDPHDIDALTEAMTELSDPVERQRCTISLNGLDQTLTLDRHITQLEELLDNTNH